MNTHTSQTMVSLKGPSTTPLILVANDDGIHSPGLLAAVEVARRLGDVVVAAPTTQQTAMGRSMTGNREDFFHPIELPLEAGPKDLGELAHLPVYPVAAWHIDASPALATRHALAVLCPQRKPDLFISGINYGENLGQNITMSGTVGAAFQAAEQGIPAVAASLQTEISNHFSYAELDWRDAVRVTYRWARRLLDLSLSQELPGDLGFDVLKVDIPNPCPAGTEERITTLSREPYFLSRIEQPGPETPISAAVTYKIEQFDRLDPHDDIYAIAVDKVAAITPVQLGNGVALSSAAAQLLKGDQM